MLFGPGSSKDRLTIENLSGGEAGVVAGVQWGGVSVSNTVWTTRGHGQETSNGPVNAGVRDAWVSRKEGVTVLR